MNFSKDYTMPIRRLLIIGLIVASVLVLISLVNYLASDTEFNILILLISFIIAFIVTFSIGLANTLTIGYLQKKLPWQKNIAGRIIAEFLWTSANAAIIICIIMLFVHFAIQPIDKNARGEIIFNNIMIAIVANLVVASILEGEYFYKYWKKSLIRVEVLRRENVESQLNALKSQINPHFMFNSLNALSSLITTDPVKARDFVAKFSRIYRYVLDIQDKTVVTLKEELDFLQSYYFLQKIRYEENLEIDTVVSSDMLNSFVPPLAIQILVENAIKHNEISQDHPLKITIRDEEGYLVIKNNFRPRDGEGYSTGVGQKNLLERYAHLSDKKPSFMVQNGNYVSKIPLIREE
jgi:two-component system LytT family sensor kinase